MKKRTRKSTTALPLMMARLTAASWETMFRRTLMMAQGTCSAAESRRMTAEKSAALQHAMAAFCTGQSQARVLAPFLNRARANARRLRRQA
jgi:predicted lipoprotein